MPTPLTAPPRTVIHRTSPASHRFSTPIVRENPIPLERDQLDPTIW